MRSSTILVGILFVLLVVFLVVNLFMPPVVGGIAAYVGEQRAGHAIIPEHIKEKWDQEGWPKKP